MSDNGITYIPDFVGEPDEALADILENVEFQQRQVRMYGRQVRVPRQEAWFGSHDYTFSGHTFPALPLPSVLDALRVRVECLVPMMVRGVLVNRYQNGADSVSWHSDDEEDMGEDCTVASVSLGAARDFRFRRKDSTPDVASALLPNKLLYNLEHGSLLVMGRGVQREWEHCLPKRRNAGLRINLTFRGPALETSQ